MKYLLVAGLALLGVACVPAPSPPPVESQCNAAWWTVTASGDSLPQGWEFRCPGETEGYDGWTFVTPTEKFIVIGWPALDDHDGGRWLRHVIAHETCHARAWEGLEPQPFDDEAATDACAARYGFPRT